MNTKYLSKPDRRAAKRLMRSRYWAYARGKILEAKNTTERARQDRDNMRKRLNTAAKNIATLHQQLRELRKDGVMVVDDPSLAKDVSSDPEARARISALYEPAHAPGHE